MFGLIASGWCVLCGFAFIVFPTFDAVIDPYLFDMPLVIFEIALGLWLLIKGVNRPEAS